METSGQLPDTSEISLTRQIYVSMKINTSPLYEKMIRKTHKWALQLQLPVESFKLLVKCQCMHGVTLISRKDINHAKSEYFQLNISKIKKKNVAVIMARTYFFFSFLSDEFQLRKTFFGK